MRNLVYKVGPKTSLYHLRGTSSEFWWLPATVPKHYYLLRFCHIGTPEAPQDVNMGHLGATMSATSQFGAKTGPNLAPCKQFLKAHDARKGNHAPTMSTKHPSKSQGPKNYEGQGQEDTHVSVSYTHLTLPTILRV